ncbi:MAG: molybdopterin-dependent oxidoreductase [Gemmataceae bacterium]|nr:molybdopterin-dependent oxidoreductase [Gemmataceae bacterium]
MPTVYVNDQPVEIGDARLNCIEAAGKAGAFIPHYCWHPALTVVASCRMCLVEVGERKPDGSVAMQPKVVPGCQTPVKDGTVIVTSEYHKRPAGTAPLNYDPKYGTPGERAKLAQADTLEGLLLNHPLDCPVCDKAGECKLQDFSYTYGRATSRMVDDKRTPPNKPDISSKITLFTDRCIMCSRCVRFTREIAGTAELTIVSRGDHAEIDVFPGEPLENKLSGNVVDLCPVGALGSKDFLYKQRVWFLQDTPSVCAGCSTGCSITIDANKDAVYRLQPRENTEAQGWFMCDEGRWGFHYVNDADRLRRPMAGSVVQPWSEVLPAIRSRFAAAGEQGPVALVLSPFLTVEEAYLAAEWAQAYPRRKLFLGPVPVVGEDDRYPKDRQGRAVEPTKFTIRAEKAPNRRGIEAVLARYQGEVLTFDKFLAEAKSFKAAWLTAGYPRGTGYPLADSPFTDEQAWQIAGIPLVVVQDLFASPVSKVAQYTLPAGAWAEKDGTFVNHAGLAQAIGRATHPAGEARTEGQVFSDLLGRRGLYRAADVRSGLAEMVPAFKDLPVLPVTNGTRLPLPLLTGGSRA